MEIPVQSSTLPRTAVGRAILPALIIILGLAAR